MTIFFSRRIKLLTSLIILILTILVSLRLIFWIFWLQYPANTSLEDLLLSFYIGVKFDLRYSLILLLPVIILTLIPKYNLSKSSFISILTRIYLTLSLSATLLIYFLDFGHYNYLSQRLDATVLRFINDITISIHMLWQSYPIVWLTILWLGCCVLMYLGISMLFKKFLTPKPRHTHYLHKIIILTFGLCFVVAGIYGKYASIQLRWSDAFFSPNNAVAALGLNPVLYFFDTLNNKKPNYDIAKVRQYYPLVSQYLGVKDKNIATLNFTRIIQPQIKATQGFNLIMVMLESMGANRLGVYGNPLNATPNLDKIATQSLFFPKFFVPVSGTARTVFASITGIADVSTTKTATRNPFIIDQHTIINSLTNYQKLYFIGGNTSWANIRGLIKNNIHNLNLYEENNYNSPRVDVWGISDANLFKEATNILATTKQPFWAYIQTAGNHRPFTIPTDNDFVQQQLPQQLLSKYGFISNAQYNAIRLADYSLGKFIQYLHTTQLIKNTIVVFFGDHNDRTNNTQHMGLDDEFDLAAVHVPMMIYSPHVLPAQKITTPANLVDLLPTLASLVGVKYKNTTLGRDLLNSHNKQNNFSFVIRGPQSKPNLGLYGRDFFLSMNPDGTNLGLYKTDTAPNQVENLTDKHPTTAKYMQQLSLGLYATSFYMLYHNKK